jgi:hypothetical protein
MRAAEQPKGKPDTAVMRNPRIQSFILVAKQFVPPSDAAERRLRESGKVPPGPFQAACLAKGLAFPAAENLQGKLQEIGYDTFIFSERNLVNTPPLRPVVSIDVLGDQIRLTDEFGQRIMRPSSSYYLFGAGRVATPRGEPIFLDVFTTGPWSDFRLVEGDASKVASELLARGGRVPASHAFVSLGKEGKIDGEPFRDLPAYDAFNMWMLQVYASGIYRKAAE